MARLFEDDQRDLAPPWLQGRYGAAWLAAHGAQKDDAVARAKDAVKARFVSLAPADALPRLGADRALERYPADTDASYRARLARAWELWEFAGTARGILAALAAAGFTAASVHPNAGPAPPGEAIWPPDGDHTWWSRFWVRLDCTVANPFAWAAVTWGQLAWGAGWTWGSTATVEQIALVRRIVRKWKAAEEVCGGIVVDLPGGHRVRWPGS